MTAQTEDLIARLEQWPNHKTGADYSLTQVQDQQKEAAQALRALQQEVERLRSIMVPFARMADEEGDYREDDHQAWGLNDVDLTWGDFRAARSALTGSETAVDTPPESV